MKYQPTDPCSVCRLPQSDHADPTIARLCKIQLAMINLRLEERELRRQVHVLKGIQTGD